MNFPAAINPDHYSSMSAKQEGFAGAHIRAVCASLGCAVSKPEPDDDKIDFTISSRVRGLQLSKPKLDVQSKSKLISAPLDPKADDFSYTADKSLYDNLRDERVATPRILVVTLVPAESEAWIAYDRDFTKLSFSSYWISIRGREELPSDQQSKTLRIPTANLFSATFLHETMHRIADGFEPFEPGA